MFAAGKTARGSVATTPVYIEEIFSTFLYTGNGSTQTITNGIDLAGKGGLVWGKSRDTAYFHGLTDTVRGARKVIYSNSTSQEFTASAGKDLYQFNNNGFTLGVDEQVNLNPNGKTMVSWTFRKQPKFFDVVTYTGNGSGAGQAINHSLGSTPGCIIIKCLDIAYDWIVYHRSVGTSQYLNLNLTSGATTGSPVTATSSTTFTVSGSEVNRNGNQFVAYVFAHNAGGFGLTGTDNVISCGSYTGNGSTTGPAITLNYEPQWLMVKKFSGAGDWVMVDNIRGIVTGGVDPRLWANLSNAENTGDYLFKLNATGFQPESLSDSINASGSDYIYIAIRRGPMAVPTVGTNVFSPQIATQNINNTNLPAAGFPVDSVLFDWRDGGYTWIWNDRLRNAYSYPTGTGSESSNAGLFSYISMTQVLSIGNFESTTHPFVFYNFRRAPQFFDEVCSTGTGTSTNLNHNLTVVPELIITKCRNASENWYVSVQNGSSTSWWQFDGITNNGGFSGGDLSSYVTTTTFNASVFNFNTNGNTYVNYLFATCAGVSKVGRYTGNGSTQTINCGFTGGARFVLIKRTGTSGEWYVYDTARGMTSGTDPYLLLNSASAETASLGSVTTVTTGFAVDASVLAAINASGGTYIFLAIA